MSKYPQRSNNLDNSFSYKKRAEGYRAAMREACSERRYTYVYTVPLKDCPTKYKHYFVCRNSNCPEDFDYKRFVEILIRAVKKVAEASSSYAGDDLRKFLNTESETIIRNTIRRYLMDPKSLQLVTLTSANGNMQMAEGFAPGSLMPAEFKPDQIRVKDIKSLEKYERSK